jgi:hypothetical protein
MNRGIIGTIIGVLVIIILVIVILRAGVACTWLPARVFPKLAHTPASRQTAKPVLPGARGVVRLDTGTSKSDPDC